MAKTEGNLEIASSKVGMDSKTARKYRWLQRLLSELAVKPRGRRPDPFADVWSEVQEQLEVSAGLEAKTLFEDLQRRYPGRLQDGQLRTLQRRVKSEGPHLQSLSAFRVVTPSADIRFPN